MSIGCATVLSADPRHRQCRVASRTRHSSLVSILAPRRVGGAGAIMIAPAPEGLTPGRSVPYKQMFYKRGQGGSRFGSASPIVDR